MKKTIWRLAPLATMVMSIMVLTTCVYVAAHESRAAWEEASSGWIADRADSICGLDDPRLLSNPARVDYPRVMRATPEMKKLHDNNIDPASPAGIQLKTQAVDRIRAAAETVRVQTGHCSVWKHISHKDGREVPELSAQVIALL
jgi:hypothetical protein